MGEPSSAPLSLPSLEYFLTDRCNLRCRHCSALSPHLSDRNLPDLAVFAESLAALDGVLVCDQIKLLGGEPLLNPDLCRFMAVAAQSPVVRRIRVATNGVLLPRMPDRFWELADVVEISIYPGAGGAPDADACAVFRTQAQRFGVDLDVQQVNRFMRPFSEHPLDDQTMGQVFATCGEAHAWSCHLLYRDALYRCSRVHVLDRFLSERGVPHDPFTLLDGVCVIDADKAMLRERLARYLSSDVPLKACRHCLGTSGRWEPCEQLAVDEARSRNAANAVPARALLVSPVEAALRARTTNWRAGPASWATIVKPKARP